MNPLENIVKYSMNENEAKAYKLLLLWNALLKQELPNYFHAKFNEKLDPRKNFAFKYTYKLVMETKGLVNDEEYKDYITAQIRILKLLQDDKGIHALISPSCLTGDKAWKRWLLWKNRKQKNKNKTILIEADNQASFLKIKHELINTYKFLSLKMSEINEDNILKSLKNKDLLKWFAFKKVSDYFILLCPVFQTIDVEKEFKIEKSLYQNDINDRAKEIYFDIFR